MKIGLIGLPLTGKTTLFRLLTGSSQYAVENRAKTQANIGTAVIPDVRIDRLTKMYQPKKITYASVEVVDIHGLMPSDESMNGASHHFLESVRQADALVHVVRAFDHPDVSFMHDRIDVLRDVESINMELLFADLYAIEKRIERIQSAKKIRPEHQEEMRVLMICKEGLENERLIHSLDLNEQDQKIVRAFQFLTERPLIVVVNLDEARFMDKKYAKREELFRYAEQNHLPVLEICARTELEISELQPDDRALFMEDLGIVDTGIQRLAATMYEHLGLISFLTVGEDEVRAWPIKQGTDAKTAGGTIHSDIERGFIRAEVVKYDDLIGLGSMQKVKEKGLARLEGKQALLYDGDIVNFRFNV